MRGGHTRRGFKEWQCYASSIVNQQGMRLTTHQHQDGGALLKGVTRNIHLQRVICVGITDLYCLCPNAYSRLLPMRITMAHDSMRIHVCSPWLIVLTGCHSSYNRCVDE